jgi:hypothetical protein
LLPGNGFKQLYGNFDGTVDREREGACLDVRFSAHAEDLAGAVDHREDRGLAWRGGRRPAWERVAAAWRRN